MVQRLGIIGGVGKETEREWKIRRSIREQFEF